MIVYGKQIVFYILDKHPTIIKQIFLTKEIDKKLFKKFMDVGAKVVRPDNMKAQALAKGGNHQGFLLDIDELEFAHMKDIKKSEFIVVLDGLSDVGNIGAIVRSCYAMGVDGIVICGLKNFYAAPIVRTSSGAMLDIPIAISYNSYDLANELKQVGFNLVGADMSGYDIKDAKPEQGQKIALFLGNEAQGLSNKLLKKLDLKVSIKMRNDFDSLNVSVAAGILIHALK
ncbi:MAG: 23S rRNA (guanosine(2251)-2'-O)-methyltransferase RlmB [Campylobacterota bacterium]|nr:23S rRNA (guanosine(2251)-2'-O)-methyltransferase RlmB [Campylobacterota bacterium]